MSSIGRQLKQRALQVQNSYLNEAISRGLKENFFFSLFFEKRNFESDSLQLTMRSNPKAVLSSFNSLRNSFKTEVREKKEEKKKKKKKKKSSQNFRQSSRACGEIAEEGISSGGQENSGDLFHSVPGRSREHCRDCKCQPGRVSNESELFLSFHFVLV